MGEADALPIPLCFYRRAAAVPGSQRPIVGERAGAALENDGTAIAHGDGLPRAGGRRQLNNECRVVGVRARATAGLQQDAARTGLDVLAAAGALRDYMGAVASAITASASPRDQFDAHPSANGLITRGVDHGPAVSAGITRFQLDRPLRVHRLAACGEDVRLAARLTSRVQHDVAGADGLGIA